MEKFVIPRQLQGSRLRRGRARIAQGSVPFGTRPLEAMYTRLVPLSTDVDEQVWAIARDAALTFRSFGAGSLTDLALALHADGWRMFPAAAEAEGFAMRRRIAASGFDAAIARYSSMAGISAAGLRATLAAMPRKVGQDTDAAVLTVRLAKAFGMAEDQPLLVSLATTLTERFPTWKALSRVDADVGAVIDAVLVDQGMHDVPSLATLWTQPDQTGVPDIGAVTLAYDVDAPAIDEASLAARFCAVAARYLAEVPDADAKAAANHVQLSVVTINASAYSWLLGVGRRKLADIDDAQAALALRVPPAGFAAVSRLRQRLAALPALAALGARAYPEARSAFGGTLNSLIATYVLRLYELRDLAQSILDAPPSPPALLADEAAFAAAGDFGPEARAALLALYDQVPEQAARVQQSLGTLLGQRSAGAGGYAAAMDAVDAFGTWLERFSGQVGQARAMVLDEDLRASWLSPFGRGRWKALVQMTPPEGPAAEVRPQLDAALEAALAAMRGAFEGLRATHGLDDAAGVQASIREQRERVALAVRRGKLDEAALRNADPVVLAARARLDQVARLARRSPAWLQDAFLQALLAQGVIRQGTVGERNVKAFLYSGQSAIYQHPMSGRHQLARLERAPLLALDVMALLRSLHALALARGAMREAILIEEAEHQLLLPGLSDRVPAADVASWLSGADADGHFPRGAVIQAFNHRFVGQVTGLLYRLNRVDFVERFDVRCFSGDTLLFVPQPGTWQPPVQYRHGRFAALLSDPGLPLQPGGGIDALPAARWLAGIAANAEADPERRAAASGLLAQLPHRWAIACDFVGAPTFEGVHVNAGVPSPWRTVHGYLLAPPRHVAGEFRALFQQGTASPHGLIFTRHYRVENGVVTEIARNVEAALPISHVHPTQSPWAPRHVMALDLGESGIGVCLVHLGTRQETAGFLKLRRVRMLAHQSEHYRRRQQPRHVFRKPYSNSIELAIKAAVGEVCHAIDALMVQYDAVPVFEAEVASARGSNVMVQRVFAAVMQRYTYLHGNGAAETVRKSHWLGASRWQFGFGIEPVPAMRQEAPKTIARAKPDKVFRDAIGTPGVVVSGYRSSLICACCGHDVLGLIDAAAAGGQDVFQTDRDGVGELRVEGRVHRVLLEARSHNAISARAARARGRRAPWEPSPDQRFDLRKQGQRVLLAKRLRMQLRRPAETIGGNRTSTWEFHCALADCGNLQQADVNAAINLARRYLARLEQARQARAGWDDAGVREAYAVQVGLRQTRAA